MAELRDWELPPLYDSADRTSLTAQRRFLIATRSRLLCLLSGTFVAAFTWKLSPQSFDIAGILAALAFSGSLVVELYLLKTKPERVWYEGRAAAESVKTLSWRFSVGGDPFPINSPQKDTELLFLSRLADTLQVLKQLGSLEAPDSNTEQITEGMRATRQLALQDRREVFERDRILNQQEWYSRKSKWNNARASALSSLMIAIEATALIGAVLKASGILSLDLLGLAAAAVASVSAWLQTKQHQHLGTAYAVTALELASVRSRIALVTHESEWSRFVDEAEKAISREHTLWKAARSVGTP